MVHHPLRGQGLSTTETIAAIATPTGRGGVGIVRISGPRAGDIALRLTNRIPPPRRAELLAVHDLDGTPLDTAIVIYFQGPNSFTGEDVLEIQGHGGPVVLDLITQAVLAAGARPARPGEFSERAFLNGKLDLVQAEAVADLIDSASAQAARSALRSLDGEFSRTVGDLVEALTQLRAYVEAAIDFSEEEIDFLAEGEVAQRLAGLRVQLEAVRAAAAQGSRLREGMTVVIAGQPNAGKSSLLNALAGRDAAIVTEVPGTTRDLLREQIVVKGMPLHVVDTAGLRESADPVEQEGIKRAWQAMERADRILLVVDDRRGFGPEEQAILERLPHSLPVTLIRNKIDCTGVEPGLSAIELGTEVRLSARSGHGLQVLLDHLQQAAGLGGSGEGVFMARRRHLDALARAAAHLERGTEVLETWRAGELLAEELRLAQSALAEITGAVSSEDLLGAIFASFCIGK